MKSRLLSRGDLHTHPSRYPTILTIASECRLTAFGAVEKVGVASLSVAVGNFLGHIEKVLALCVCVCVHERMCACACACARVCVRARACVRVHVCVCINPVARV